MAYTRVFLTSADDDDPSIRVALGFAGTDTTTVPSEALICAQPFLPMVERNVKRVIEDYATILAAADTDRIADLKLGVALGTAAALAASYFARRDSESVKQAGLGDQATTWRDGVNWLVLAKALAKQSAALLASVGQWTEETSMLPDLVTVAGPTRAAVDRGTTFSTQDWEDLMVPLVVAQKVR